MNETKKAAAIVLALGTLLVCVGCGRRNIRDSAVSAPVLVALHACDWINEAAPADMGEASLEIIRLRSRAVECDLAVEGAADAIGIER